MNEIPPRNYEGYLKLLIDTLYLDPSIEYELGKQNVEREISNSKLRRIILEPDELEMLSVEIDKAIDHHILRWHKRSFVSLLKKTRMG
jgi:hypothetical protein